MLVDGDDVLRPLIPASALAAACLVVALPLVAADVPGEDEARDAAKQVGSALERGEASALRAVLPARGKVRLHLERLGPQDGSFSAQQVEALLGGFLDEGAVLSFELTRLDHQSLRYALAHARLSVRDRQGRHADVVLRLAFQPEEGRWVLREIREAPR